MVITPIKHSNRNAEIKQNLFRFVHIKDVEVNTDPSDTVYTTVSPDAVKSVILSQIVDVQEPEVIQEKIKIALDNFNPIRGLDELQNLNKTLTQFSFWLKKNKSNLKLTEVLEQLTGVTAYLEENLNTLWDNLFYFVLTNKSNVIRDELLKLIQTNHFILTFETLKRDFTDVRFTKSQKKLVDKVASARIMIPAYLFPKVNSSSITPVRDTKGDKILSQILTRNILEDEIKQLNSFKIEFQKVLELYFRENSNAYITASKQYEQAIEDAYEAATKIKDPETGEITYEGLELPSAFEFTPLDMFNVDFLANNLSNKSRTFYTTTYSGKVDSYEEILKDIDTKITSKYNDLIKIEIVTYKTVLFNGSSIEVNYMPTVPKIVMKRNIDFSDSSSSDIFITLFHPSNEELINEMSIKIDENESIDGVLINEKDNLFTFKFSKSEGDFTGDENTKFTGRFRSTSMRNYSFGKDMLPGTNITFSCVLDTGLRVYFDSKSGAWLFQDENGDWNALEPSLLPKNCILDGEPGTVNGPLYGVRKAGIAEFKRVEQELCCYVEGEVSHIENILAREYKEKSTRSLTRSEITTEETEENESESLSDTTSTDRYEMQQEVAQVLEKSKELNYGASTSVSGSYGGMNFGVNANIGGSNSSSSSNSFNTSESFAKEVVERAMERVVKKSTYKRTSRMLKEFEENNKHGFDNRKGSKHVTGIYRWVDKIYNNKLVNYGKRLTYEFAIPEPAKMWKEMVITKPNLPEPPTPPNHPGAININNYLAKAAEFGVDVEHPKPNKVVVGRAFEDSSFRPGDESYSHGSSYNMKIRSKSDSITIPDGYKAVKVYYHGNTYSDDKCLRVHFGKTGIYVNNGFSGNLPLNNETVELPIAIYSRIESSDRNAYAFSVDVECTLVTEEQNRWLGETTIAIMEAYNKKFQEYLDQFSQWETSDLAQQNAELDGINYNNNSLTNRKIEQTELKKVAIIYLLSQVDDVNIGQNFWNNSTSSINMTNSLSKYAEHIKFLEEAIDWKIMAYDFQPYFWADEAKWKEMIQHTSQSDPIFEAFLQAGFANLRVPVAGGYEKEMMFFLDTGRIWKKGDILVADVDAEYVSIDASLEINSTKSSSCCSNNGDELVPEDSCQTLEDVCIEAKWTSRVPTTLTIVQDYAAPLSANGLPCFSKTDPRIKYCEDGTPLGGLPEDYVDQNAGVMVGLENEDVAYSCSIMLNNQATLLVAANTIVDGITDPEGDNTDAVAQLQEILDTLNDLFADGEANGCNVIPVQQSIEAVEAHIAELS